MGSGYKPDQELTASRQELCLAFCRDLTDQDLKNSVFNDFTAKRLFRQRDNAFLLCAVNGIDPYSEVNNAS